MWLFICLLVTQILFEIPIKLIQVRNSPVPHQSRCSPREILALSELRSHKLESPRGVGMESFDVVSAKYDPYFNKDHILISFLRAQNLDVAAAARMTIRALEWRKENRIDSILIETFPDIPNKIHSFEGFDNDGRPVLYLKPGPINLRKLLFAGKRDRFLRKFDQVLEDGLQVLKNLSLSGRRSPNGEELTQIVLVLDNAGFSMRNHFCLQCVSVHTEFASHIQNYYPNACKYMVIINSPKTAMPLLQILAPVLSKASRTAAKIFGPDISKWSAFLRSIIPENQLPIRYGGKMPPRLN